MAEVYKPGAMSKLYQKLDDFVRDDVNRETTDEYRFLNPDAPNGKLDWNRPGDRPPAREWLEARDSVLEKMMKGHSLKKPSTVFQYRHPICWAAALQSWLEVRLSQPIPAQKLVKKFATDPSGMLVNSQDLDIQIRGAKPIVPQIYRVLDAFGMSYVLQPRNRMTYAFFSKSLRDVGHLYVIYNAGGMAHAIVVWGIFINSDNGECGLRVMDPLLGHAGRSLMDLRSRGAMIAFIMTRGILTPLK